MNSVVIDEYADVDDKLAKKAAQNRETSKKRAFLIFVVVLSCCVGVQVAAGIIYAQKQQTAHASIETELNSLQKSQESAIKKIEALSDALRTIASELSDVQQQAEAAHKAEEIAIGEAEQSSRGALKEMKSNIESQLQSLQDGAKRDITQLKEYVEKKQQQQQQQQEQPGVDQSNDNNNNARAIDPNDENGGEAVPESGGDDFVVLPPPPHDPLDDLPSEKERNAKRRETVRQEFLHSWKAYKRHAWGHDELQPLTKSHKDWDAQSGGLGLTILDSLSTLYLMDHKKEFAEAIEWVTEKMDLDIDIDVSQFETTIRILGALLSSYELTGEKNEALLRKAVEVADRVLWAYNTTSGIPHSTVNLKTHRHHNPSWTGGASVLSEFGTVQLEMRTLSYHTKNPVYDMKATQIMNILDARCKDMLCSTYFSPGSMQWLSDHITLGALGDSFYEYLLKQYLLTGKTEKRYKKNFVDAAQGIIRRLVKSSVPSQQMYVSEFKNGGLFEKMDHLACFTGGMYALGALKLKGEIDTKTYNHWRDVARGLTDTCHLMYSKQRTGIAPEIVEFPGNQDFINGAPYYLLRPETAEAYFYMWRTTREQKYRDWAWDMVKAIMKHCKVEEGGYSGLRHVNILPAPRDNLMQSFWMAETLKYLYLIFCDDAALDLDKWVLNTEAHPFKIRQRDPMDVLETYEAAHGALPYNVPHVTGVKRIETPKMKAARLAREAKGVVDEAVAEDPSTDEEGQENFDGGKPYENVGQQQKSPPPPPPVEQVEMGEEKENPSEDTDTVKKKRRHEQRLEQEEQEAAARLNDNVIDIPVPSSKPVKKQNEE
eukprot:PhM_4_TR18027/c0_g1_i1/m.93096/K01230/MAN1; mannosyl-oligosaccharide alpha-1,2-mannosidase